MQHIASSQLRQKTLDANLFCTNNCMPQNRILFLCNFDEVKLQGTSSEKPSC